MKSQGAIGYCGCCGAKFKFPEDKQWITKLAKIGTTLYFGFLCKCGAHTDMSFNTSSDCEPFIKAVGLYSVGYQKGKTNGPTPPGAENGAA